ncbi:MAG: endonuclease domain-containing protein [Alphaproteobacteria bacterium]
MAKPPRKAAGKEIASARRLRKNQTDAEAHIWYRLRARQLGDWKFKRQVPIGKYVVDFVCKEAGLIVEIDGGQHAIDPGKDNKRTANLEENGYQVIRFWNNEVLGNVEGVLTEILRVLDAHPSPQPSPRRGEGEER